MAGIAVAFQEVERHCIEDSRVSCINNAFQYMKVYFRIRFATAKPCFALQFLPPTSGRNCAATRATPSEVLGWSRANSANAYWTLYTITLAHTILGIWYATLKKTQENNSQENRTSVERFCDIQTVWVGLGGSRLQ